MRHIAFSRVRQIKYDGKDYNFSRVRRQHITPHAGPEKSNTALSETRYDIVFLEADCMHTYTE